MDRLKMLLQIQDCQRGLTIKEGIRKMAAEGGSAGLPLPCSLWGSAAWLADSEATSRGAGKLSKAMCGTGWWRCVRSPPHALPTFLPLPTLALLDRVLAPRP